MSCWALIALKAPIAAKGRLAETLSTGQRSRLVELMFANVLAALRAANSLAGIAVVTTEPLHAAGVTVLTDPGGGLNAALAYGAHELATRGADELLVLHADLPLLNGDEVDRMVTAGRVCGLAIAPDKQGEGTNAIFIRLPTVFRFHFGVRSFGKHLAEAAAHGLDPRRVDLPGLAFDVDEPQDIERLIADGGEAYRFLQQA